MTIHLTPPETIMKDYVQTTNIAECGHFSYVLFDDSTGQPYTGSQVSISPDGLGAITVNMQSTTFDKRFYIEVKSNNGNPLRSLSFGVKVACGIMSTSVSNPASLTSAHVTYLIDGNPPVFNLDPFISANSACPVISVGIYTNTINNIPHPAGFGPAVAVNPLATMAFTATNP